jgi:hypothetical protein
VDGPAEVEAHAARGQLVDDVPGVGHGASQSVELADHEGVAGATGRQRLAEAGSGAVGAGEAVVDVDPLGLDPEGGEGVALGSEVLGVRRDPCVSDLESGHLVSVAV